MNLETRRTSICEFYQMLCGALLTVRRMVKRPPLKLPVFRTSSFCGFKACWPANADCWIAVVAISLRGMKRMIVDGRGLEPWRVIYGIYKD